MADENIPPNGGGDPWYKGLSGATDEVVGFWSAKGWDKTAEGKPTDAATIALNATHAWKAAERLIGAPADEMLRLPKDAASPDWGKVWSRLGKPENADGYDVSTVKRADGSDLDPDTAKFVKETAFKLNMPKAAAADLAKDLLAHNAARDAAGEAERSAALTGARAALAKQWGTTPEGLDQSPHMLLAKSAAVKLGIDPNAVAALEKVVGYEKTMDMFRELGVKMGEDKFVGGEGGGGGPMTAGQAQARKSELYGDSKWVASFLAGDQAAVREMGNLDRILSAGKTVF